MVPVLTPKHTRQAGFTLMELAIVMLIVAVVAAGGASLFSEKDRSDKYDGVKAEMIEIDDGLAVFLSQNDRLPCPAPLTASKGDATYARETDCTDTTPPAGTFRVEHPASSGNFVRIGAAPIYDMEMPDEYVADAWYGKYLYAVSEGLTAAMTSSSTGNITVQDEASADIQTDVAWVVVSMGKDTMGAYAARNDNMILNCASGTLDEENCDYNNGIFRDTTFNDGSITANYFDDIIRWETVPQLYNIQLTVSGGGGGGSSLPDTCTSGQIIEYNGSNWVCGTDNAGTTLPTCTADETIFFDGTSWICSPSSSLPDTCTSGQIIEYNGSNWVCGTDDDTEAELPSCTASEILYYNGSNWICGPTCSNDQLLAKSGSNWVCIDTPSGGGGGTVPGPTDVKLTTAKHNGNFGGAKAMNDWIQTNGCAGYSVCTMNDIITYFLRNDANYRNIIFDAAWVGGLYLDNNKQLHNFSCNDNGQHWIRTSGYAVTVWTANDQITFLRGGCSSNRYAACCKFD